MKNITFSPVCLQALELAMGGRSDWVRSFGKKKKKKKDTHIKDTWYECHQSEDVTKCCKGSPMPMETGQTPAHCQHTSLTSRTSYLSN